MTTSLLLLACLALVGSDASEGRRQVAARLEQSLAEVRSAPDERALAVLVGAAEAQLPSLQGMRAAGRLRALLDSPPTRARLERELARLAADLAFEPLIEAPLPKGFPAPTAIGEIELKRYPGYRMARTDKGWTQGYGAFWTLFRHIQAREIAMTAPVEMTWETDERGLREQSMAFLYANTELGSAGRQGQVEVLDVPAASVVSLGWRGRPSARQVAAARDELLAWIAARPDLEVCGELRVLAYNGPSVSDARACSEVQLPVRPR